MSLIEGNGLSAADVAAVTGNGRGGMFGGYDGGLFWIIILFLFAMIGGWGNGFGGGNGGGAVNYNNGVQDGFNQASVMNGIAAIQTAQNANQTALLQTLGANQIAANQQMNTLAMSLQNCCCENRAGIANLQYTIANDGANTRQTIQAGVQQVLDKLCQQEIDALKAQNANLQTQVNLANLAASQTAQTARILQDNAAQTQALEQYLNPTPIPAYVVQNPNCCSGAWNGYYNNIVS